MVSDLLSVSIEFLVYPNLHILATTLLKTPSQLRLPEGKATILGPNNPAPSPGVPPSPQDQRLLRRHARPKPGGPNRLDPRPPPPARTHIAPGATNNNSAPPLAPFTPVVPVHHPPPPVLHDAPHLRRGQARARPEDVRVLQVAVGCAEAGGVEARLEVDYQEGLV